MNDSLLRRTHVLQQDRRDCGVACLRSLIRYYEGDCTFEDIRRLCGADISGTSLLGLKEAATKLGLIAEGYESTLEGLISHNKPVILYVELENGLEHYVIWYGRSSNSDFKESQFLVGDPAKGIQQLTNSELESIWKSGICLALEPGPDFVKEKFVSDQKRNWLFENIKEDIALLSICAALGVVIATLGLAMAIYSQQLIDQILPSKNLNRVMMSTALVIILLFCRVGLVAIRQLLLLRQNMELGIRLNHAFYEKLLFLPRSFFDSRKIGDFVTRLNDTSRIKNTVTNLLGSLLIDFILVLSSICLLFYYNWIIGAISFSILPFYFILIFSKTSEIVKAQRNVMAANSLSDSNYINTIAGISDIQSKNKQHFFNERNKELYGDYQKMIYRSGVLQVRVSTSVGITAVILIGIVLSTTIYQVHLNLIRVGEMTAILGTLSALLPSVNSIAMASIPLNDARVSFDRMYEFLNIQTRYEESVAKPVIFQSLDIANLSFRFPGKRPLLRDISLSVRKGEVISIVSESGGGKSIVCQIIQKFLSPEAGKILVNGNISLDSIDDASWHTTVAIVPQHVHLFNGTIIQNICFTDSSRDVQAALELLQEHGFAPFFSNLPQGVLTTIGEEGVRLSGGQKQLIGLARALVGKPQLLILDEATAFLDKYSESFVLELLLKLKKTTGIIFITHRLHTLKSICDRIYILEKGTITESGEHRDLMFSSNIYSSYWFTWAGGNVGTFS